MLELPAIIIYTILCKIYNFVWGGGSAGVTQPISEGEGEQDVTEQGTGVEVPDHSDAENRAPVVPEAPGTEAPKVETPEALVGPIEPNRIESEPDAEDVKPAPSSPFEELGDPSDANSDDPEAFVPAGQPSPEIVGPNAELSQDSEDSPDIEELKLSSFTGAAGTVVEMPGWDVEGAAEKIYKACKGLGTTEADITEVVCSISNAQRQTLREKYLAMYGEDLMDRLKSELKSRYQDVIIGLMTPPDEYLADWLQWAMKGAGTEEDTLIEILCCRTNEELERVKNAYKAKCERDLEEDIESELTGEFQRLVRAVLACGRDESGTVDKDLAKSDAQELLDAGANQWGTDESKFNAILCTRSYPHLRQVFRYYNEISGTDITEAIDAEFTGHAQAGMLAIVSAVRDPAGYYAGKLNLAMEGAGTRDNILIRIIVGRSEIDLTDIKAAYAAKYEIPLAERVAADTRGDYEEALLKIIG